MKIFEYLKSIKTIEEMAWFLTYYAEELDPYDENRALEWLDSEYAEADKKP